MAGLSVKIEGKGKNQELVIRLPLEQPPRPSATGKTLVVASSRGNQITDVTVNDKPVTVGVNAYISNR